MTGLGTAVFVGAARNCARFLPDALDRWRDLGGLFDKPHFIVAENDSTDGTKALLETWRSAGPGREVLTLDGIGRQVRSVAIAQARNALLDHVASRPDLAGADYLIVMDMDDASLAITPATMARCMAFDGWDALFANQLFYFNDVWALRHPTRSPDDWAARVDAKPPGWRRAMARLRHLTWRNRPIAPWRSPFAVDSAFGGLAIYRMRHALGSRYLGYRYGRAVCEHVPYHEELKANGARLVLHPGLINMAPHAIHRLVRRALS